MSESLQWNFYKKKNEFIKSCNYILVAPIPKGSKLLSSKKNVTKCQGKDLTIQGHVELGAQQRIPTVQIQNNSSVSYLQQTVTARIGDVGNRSTGGCLRFRPSGTAKDAEPWSRAGKAGGGREVEWAWAWARARDEADGDKGIVGRRAPPAQPRSGRTGDEGGRAAKGSSGHGFVEAEEALSTAAGKLKGCYCINTPFSSGRTKWSDEREVIITDDLVKFFFDQKK